ncbi:hypothetical protein H6F89_27905 [Cyanobacteria bacterium FACHB-63]|nr:hypothetical protein [Cyanobacteria bacterium FACHB-63]
MKGFFSKITAATLFLGALSSISIVSPALAETWLCRTLGIGCRQTIPAHREEYESRGDIETWSFFAKPQVSLKFSGAQRERLWQALTIAQQRIQDPRVLSCIKRYVAKGYSLGSNPQMAVVSFVGAYPSAHLNLRKGQGRQASSTYRGGYQYLRIDRIDEARKRDGGITVGRASTAFDVSSRDMEIDMNAVALDDPKVSVDALTGVIVHEILHLWKYDHSSASDMATLSREAPGNFVYESGWCVERAGADKTPGEFGLTENSLSGSGLIFPE